MYICKRWPFKGSGRVHKLCAVGAFLDYNYRKSSIKPLGGLFDFEVLVILLILGKYNYIQIFFYETVGQYPNMLAPQLLGRLLTEVKNNDNIKTLLRQCDEEGPIQNALIPTYHCMHTPGGPLKYVSFYSRPDQAQNWNLFCHFQTFNSY